MNREIKRRTDVVGFGGKTAPHAVFLSASLPNDEAIIVPGAYAAPQGPRSPSTVGAIEWRPRGSLLETNDEWTVARRYMSLETLARVNDNHNLRFPAVAT